MRSIAAVLIILALPATAQAIQPQRGPDAPARLPGIVDRTPPGTEHIPNPIEVRVRASDRVVTSDLREARRSIERRHENGEISRREARRLRRAVSRVAGLARRYGQDGLSGSEVSELQLHANVVRSQAEAPRVAAR
jgi:hypothetical protein